MRYIQKMQTGLALAAILMCFTTTTIAVRSAAESDVTLEQEGKTFQSISGVDVAEEGTFEFFAETGKPVSLYTVRPSSPAHETLAESINDSTQVDAKLTKTPYLLVIYTATGIAERVLHVAPNGMFVDEKTHKMFLGGHDLRAIVSSLRAEKAE